MVSISKFETNLQFTNFYELMKNLSANDSFIAIIHEEEKPLYPIWAKHPNGINILATMSIVNENISVGPSSLHQF